MYCSGATEPRSRPARLAPAIGCGARQNFARQKRMPRPGVKRKGCS
jgi:hypothetical protein